jgi:methionine-S-sulfoxide reductase
VGYTGGTTRNPTYESIGDHSEAIEIEFDPGRLSYADLLKVFWGAHDPRARSFSRQYRAAVFYLTDDQRRLALASRDEEARKGGREVATEVLPSGVFTPAEGYHQKYYLRGERELAGELRERFPRDAPFVDSTAAARVNGYVGGNGTPEQLAAEIGSFGLSPRGRARLEAIVAERHPGAACPVGGVPKR